MNRELKREWLADLRSGRFPQTQEILRRDEPMLDDTPVAL